MKKLIILFVLFCFSVKLFAQTGIVYTLADSTQFVSCPNGIHAVKLQDTLVGDGSLFLKVPKGTNHANRGTFYLSNTSDSLWARQGVSIVEGYHFSWWAVKPDYVSALSPGTDNSASVQFALNSFPKRSGTFIFNKRGAYRFNSTILLGQNTHIKGVKGIGDHQGETGGVVVYYTNLVKLYFKGDINGFQTDQTVAYRSQGNMFDDFDITSDSANLTKAAFSALLCSTDPDPIKSSGFWYYHHVAVEDFATGFNLAYADSHYITECTVGGCKYGAQIGSNAVGVVLDKCDFSNISNTCVIDSALQTIITQTDFENSPAGLKTSGTEPVYTHNYFFPLTATAVEALAGSHRMILSSNVFHSIRGNGVQLDSAAFDFDVSNNQFYFMGDTTGSNLYTIYANHTTGGIIDANVMTVPNTHETAAVYLYNCSYLNYGINNYIRGYTQTVSITPGTAAKGVANQYTDQIFYGNLTVTGNPVYLNTLQSTISGTSGSAISSEPFAGTSYKKIIVYFNSYVGAGTYTFPSAFNHVPAIVLPAISGLSLTPHTNSLDFSSSGAVSGFVILEGY